MGDPIGSSSSASASSPALSSTGSAETIPSSSSTTPTTSTNDSNNGSVASPATAAPEEPQTINVANGPVHGGGGPTSNCPHQVPVSGDPCSQGVSGTWTQCQYLVPGNYNERWICNCGSNNLFYC